MAQESSVQPSPYRDERLSLSCDFCGEYRPAITLVRERARICSACVRLALPVALHAARSDRYQTLLTNDAEGTVTDEERRRLDEELAKLD